MSYSMDCVPLSQLCAIVGLHMYTLVPGMCTMPSCFFFSFSFAHSYVYYCCFVDESFFQCCYTLHIAYVWSSTNLDKLIPPVEVLGPHLNSFGRVIFGLAIIATRKNVDSTLSQYFPAMHRLTRRSSETDRWGHTVRQQSGSTEN